MEDMKDTLARTEETESKNEKKKTNAEMLDEIKTKLKDIQKKIKALKDNKDKTDSEKAELKELQAKLPALKVKKAGLQKKVDNAKQNAIIRAEGKKLAERKQEAINKVLEAEGLNTENGVKSLIALLRVIKNTESKVILT